jgi:Zn-dependent M28 family amino/carboxypeptidase
MSLTSLDTPTPLPQVPVSMTMDQALSLSLRLPSNSQNLPSTMPSAFHGMLPFEHSRDTILTSYRWSAEEEGLLGAAYYVSQAPQSELDKIRLMLDFDMMASPNFAFQIYDGDGSAYGLSGPPGSAEAEAAFTQFFVEEMHENYTQIEFDGRSDYGPFLEAGVATGGIACGAEAIKTVEEAVMFGGEAGVAYDVNYHAAGDTVENLNMAAWIVMTKAIAHMTATYARSFDSLPLKAETAKAKRVALESRNALNDKAYGKTWGI